METLLDTLQLAAIGAVEIGIIVAIVAALSAGVRRYYSTRPGFDTRRQLIQAAFALFGVILIIVVLPIGDARRGQLLSLLGLLLSAAIALSSTTLLGNAMAGVMLRVVKSFRPGAFVRVGTDHFGRVTEMDLLHVELQTEDRDLVTLSNLYVVANSIRVIRESGTIMSVQVTLGYDVPHQRVEELLLQAAHAAKLEEPFVQILELGDFSVSYRVAGLLTDVKTLISTRSLLRATTLDALHGGGVEIVSPNFMNTRALDPAQTIIPEVDHRQVAESETAPDAIVFDKAEEAESIEALRERHDALLKEIEGLEAGVKAAAEDSVEGLRADLASKTTQAETLAVQITATQGKLKDLS